MLIYLILSIVGHGKRENMIIATTEFTDKNIQLPRGNG